MNKILNIKNSIGVLLIISALALQFYRKPVVIEDISLINVSKPTQEIIELVKPVSNIVSDITDRTKMAIFNQEFANRVKQYDIDVQQLNDLYVLAASEFFQQTLDNKYNNLDKELVGLISKVTTEDNHKLTEEEKNKLSTNFNGLAWSLIQKR